MAIIECEEFHQTTDEMLDWLNSVERKLNDNEPVDLSAEPERLIEQYRLFSVRVLCLFLFFCQIQFQSV